MAFGRVNFAICPHYGKQIGQNYEKRASLLMRRGEQE